MIVSPPRLLAFTAQSTGQLIYINPYTIASLHPSTFSPLNNSDVTMSAENYTRIGLINGEVWNVKEGIVDIIGRCNSIT